MRGEVKTGNPEKREKGCKGLRDKERESNNMHVAWTLKKGLCGGEQRGRLANGEWSG